MCFNVTGETRLVGGGGGGGMNEFGRQKPKRQNSWQYVKHTKLYSDLFQAALRSQHRGPQFLSPWFPLTGKVETKKAEFLAVCKAYKAVV